MSSAPEGSQLNPHVPDLFRRHQSNPLLTAASWPYAANTVFNPGATRLPSGETLLLVRVEDRRGISHLTAARSRDGIHDWQIDPQQRAAATGACTRTVYEQQPRDQQAQPRVV